MKWKCFVSHRCSDTNTDQCTDQKTVIHTKRVNRIVPLKTAYDLIELLSPRSIPPKRFQPASTTRQNNKKKEMTRESVAKDIANAITTWETYDWKDTDLWESFQDDFKGYTEDDFRLVNNNNTRRLRNFLRRRGVWIEKSRTTIARFLFHALQEEEPTQWTDADIQEYLLTEGAFDSYRINVRLKKTLITLLPDIVPPTVSPSIPPIIKPTSSLSNVSTNNPPPATSNSEIPASQGYGRKLANLAKMYTDETKYSGENDSFTCKLTIFHDIGARADIPQKILLKAFLTMLTSLALDYYYSNTSISTAATFDKVCDSIRTYFEGAEYKKSVLSKWNMTTLKSSIDKNEGMLIEECL